MTNVKQTPPAAPEAEAPKADFTPELESQPSAKELELQATIDRLQAEADARDENPTHKEAAAKLRKDFVVPKGEEKYTHVLETQVNGEEIAPRIRAYDPTQYTTMISKQPGYKGDILTAKK